ncbi:MAG TPA: hypothetical protein VLH38_04700 [Patescibacteria group bacterium]|nr:hypothetical protein [Patescibacteria group bacterium]
MTSIKTLIRPGGDGLMPRAQDGGYFRVWAEGLAEGLGLYNDGIDGYELEDCWFGYSRELARDFPDAKRDYAFKNERWHQDSRNILGTDYGPFSFMCGTLHEFGATRERLLTIQADLEERQVIRPFVYEGAIDVLRQLREFPPEQVHTALYTLGEEEYQQHKYRSLEVLIRSSLHDAFDITVIPGGIKGENIIDMHNPDIERYAWVTKLGKVVLAEMVVINDDSSEQLNPLIGAGAPPRSLAVRVDVDDSRKGRSTEGLIVVDSLDQVIPILKAHGHLPGDS